MKRIKGRLKRPPGNAGRGVEEIRHSVQEVLSDARKGDPSLPGLVNLPIVEMLSGLPRTFITFNEWCSLGWFDIPLNPFSPLEWEDDFDILNSRFTDVLFGTWLAWYHNYVTSIWTGWPRKKKPIVRRLDGTVVNGLVFEQKVFQREGEKRPGLYATFSRLRSPVNPEWVACVGCVLHSSVGEYYAEAFAWNPMTGDATQDDALEVVEEWASSFCTNLSGKFYVSEAYTMCPEPGGGLFLPYKLPPVMDEDEKPRGYKGGRVIPFRAKKTPDVLH